VDSPKGREVLYATNLGSRSYSLCEAVYKKLWHIEVSNAGSIAKLAMGQVWEKLDHDSIRRKEGRGGFRSEVGDHDVAQLITLEESSAALNGSGGPDQAEHYTIAKRAHHRDRVPFRKHHGRMEVLLWLKLSGQTLAGTLTVKSSSDTRSDRVKMTRVRQFHNFSAN